MRIRVNDSWFDSPYEAVKFAMQSDMKRALETSREEIPWVRYKNDPMINRAEWLKLTLKRLCDSFEVLE